MAVQTKPEEGNRCDQKNAINRDITRIYHRRSGKKNKRKENVVREPQSHSKALWALICIEYQLNKASEFLSDLDECNVPGANNCSPNADCANSHGSFNCSCRPGYIGDGANCSGRFFEKPIYNAVIYSSMQV